ncbi:MAG: hypothetical protein ACP5D3_07215 [Sulfurovum sp.]
MQKSFVRLLILTSIFIFIGCASKSSGIKANSVSHTEYMKYSCKELDRMYDRISDNLTQISHEQDSTSNKDAVTMGVTLLLFAPAALYLAAGEDQEKQIADLKGKKIAIQEAEKRKKCY